MKNCKRLFSLLLALVLVCALLPWGALPARAETLSGVCGVGVTWTLDKDKGTLVISGSGDMIDYANRDEAPWFDY